MSRRGSLRCGCKGLLLGDHHLRFGLFYHLLPLANFQLRDIYVREVEEELDEALDGDRFHEFGQEFGALGEELHDLHEGAEGAALLDEGGDAPSLEGRVHVDEFLPPRHEGGVEGLAAGPLEHGVVGVGVLEARLQGTRDDVVEVIVDPSKLSSYGLRPDVMIAGVMANNQLIAAGAMEGSEGRYAIKVPSLIETLEDVARLPVVASDTAVVRAMDIAEIRPTLKDPVNITRLDGKPAVAIEVSKRIGANLIETVDEVRAVTEVVQKDLPDGVKVSFSQDKSITIRQLLSDLQNSVLTAVVLVFIVILYALTVRSSILIGLAIPASFLMGILGLQMAGLTVNLVVLFSLILAVGMLVDDAIIVVEYAERRIVFRDGRVIEDAAVKSRRRAVAG